VGEPAASGRHGASGPAFTVAAGHPRRGVRRGAEVVEGKIRAIHIAFGWQVSDMLQNRDNPEWLKHYRKAYAEADKAFRALIEANFAWFPRRYREPKQG
jgi:hypothetical protein